MYFLLARYHYGPDFYSKKINNISISSYLKKLSKDKRNNNYPQFSDHYFTGEYPIKALDKLGDEKITQLSLLSNKSSS